MFSPATEGGSGGGSGGVSRFFVPLGAQLCCAPTGHSFFLPPLLLQVVVVAPSRELAMQIVRVAQSLLPESARRGVQQAIGGANVWRQRDNLKVRLWGGGEVGG